MPSNHGRGRGACLGAGLALLLSLAGSACFDIVPVERPRTHRPPVPTHVQISRVVPEGCTALGEVSGSGSATDDPVGALEEARDQIRRRADALGGNYVLIEMQTDGTTNVEGRSEGGQTWTGRFESESTVTAEIEAALWGQAYYCPWGQQRPAGSTPAGATVPDGNPCATHADCPPQQFCSPAGRCRRP